MWTISNKQLDAISNSIRREFEQRAYFVLSKEDSTKGRTEEEVKQNIHNQMDRLIRFSIKEDDRAFRFIRLSFEYPVLQVEEWDKSLENKLLQCEDESEKIEILTNYLI